MATWTNVPNTSLDVGKAARSVDIKAIRDNITALAEGASGAPKIDGTTSAVVETGGIVDGAVTGAKIASTTITNSKIANSTIGSEKLQTGTAERDWVLARTSSAAVGVVGSYAFLSYRVGNDDISPGTTIAASDLRYANAGGGLLSFPQPSGTWRLMGFLDDSGGFTTSQTSVFLRIS